MRYGWPQTRALPSARSAGQVPAASYLWSAASSARVFVFLLIFPLCFGLLALLLYGGGRLTRSWRYKSVARTWLAGFALELFGLLWVKEGTLTLPGLGIPIKDGLHYVMAFTIEGMHTLKDIKSGRQPDAAVLLLLPVLPALLRYGYERWGQPTRPPVG
jgi:hypothetical protein